MSGIAGGIPAGWHPDPAGSAQLRYWDGTSWTEHFAPFPGTAGPGSGASGPPGGQGAAAAPAASVGAAAVGAPGGSYAYPNPAVAPTPQGMSGCLKAFLIGMVVVVVGGVALVGVLLFAANRVVHHLSTTIAGTPGRPSSLPSGASDYSGERKQDHVAGSSGAVTLGSVTATATDWMRVPATSGPALVCGDVSIQRSTISSKDSFDAAMRLAGDMSWELLPPSGSPAALDGSSSSVSALGDYLTTGQSGNASGKVCFDDPGGSGQFAITWQPRLFRAERAVWIVHL